MSLRNPKISYFLLYSGCLAGVLGFAALSIGGSIRDGSSQARYLRSVGHGSGFVAFLLVGYAAGAVYFGRKGVVDHEATLTAKKEADPDGQRTTRGL